MRNWLRQRSHQRRLALGLLTLAFGCFAQAVWLEAKAELVQALFEPATEQPILIACYVPDGLQPAATQR